MRLLCVMHTCEPYGHLTFRAGLPATNKEISKVTGVHPLKVPHLIPPLVSRGVLGVLPGGVLYSKRMVRDYQKRLINKQNGEKGGNPNVLNSVNPPLKASSSSYSVSKDKETHARAYDAALSSPTLPAKTPEPAPSEKFRQAYNEAAKSNKNARIRGCLGMNKERDRLFKTAWKEHPDMAYWQSVFDRIKRSPWATGTQQGRDGNYYQADMSFVLRHHIEILEGKYDDLSNCSRAGAAKKPKSAEVLPEPDMTPEEMREITRNNLGPRSAPQGPISGPDVAKKAYVNAESPSGQN